MDPILDVGLEKIVLSLGPYYPHLVREFIVNLSQDFDDPTSLSYQRVHVRRYPFIFPVALIKSIPKSKCSANGTEQCPSMKN